MKSSVLTMAAEMRFTDELLINAAEGIPTTRKSYCMDRDCVCVGSMVLHVL